jgi:hypothetical protein
MTEENTPDVQIGLEQIFAAVLAIAGPVEMQQEALLENYSQYAIAVSPVEDGKITIGLVDLNQVEEQEVAE